MQPLYKHSRPYVLAAILALGLAPAMDLHAQNAIPVQVQPLADVLVEMERSAPADVKSLNTTTISAEVTAVVRTVNADAGQAVKRGDLLLELDARDYELALEQALANLESAQAQKAQADARLKRAQDLSARQYVSADDLLARETDMRVVEAQIRIQEAAVDIARRNLEKCAVHAPFDGVVNDRWAQLGAYVTPGTALLEVTQTDRFELDAEIPDELAASLVTADSMAFSSRGESWDVQLLRLSPIIDTQRRTRQARFEFTGPSPAVGRSGEIVWYNAKGLLPVNLVVRRDGRLGVFLNRGGKAGFVPLPNAQEGRPVPVSLPLTEEVVVQGRERLQDGDPIAPGRVSP